MLASYNRMEDLIQIGAYQTGTSPEVDMAIRLRPAVERFLQQSEGRQSTWEDTQSQLGLLGQAWQSSVVGTAATSPTTTADQRNSP
jgi:flagellum-specific ATP synthase